MVIWPGLDADNPQRRLQPRPAVIGIGFADGLLPAGDAGRDAEQQLITVDSGAPVTRLRLGIASDPSGDGATSR